jgi:methionyl-tRNA formyltransferase
MSYAKKLSKEEAFIDWNQTAITIARKIWAFNPWPVAQAYINGELVRIWGAEPLEGGRRLDCGKIIKADKNGIDVACKEGLLRITELQFPGGKVLPIKDLLNSKQTVLKAGNHFS